MTIKKWNIVPVIMLFLLLLLAAGAVLFAQNFSSLNTDNRSKAAEPRQLTSHTCTEGESFDGAVISNTCDATGYAYGGYEAGYVDCLSNQKIKCSVAGSELAYDFNVGCVDAAICASENPAADTGNGDTQTGTEQTQGDLPGSNPNTNNFSQCMGADDWKGKQFCIGQELWQCGPSLIGQARVIETNGCASSTKTGTTNSVKPRSSLIIDCTKLPEKIRKSISSCK